MALLHHPESSKMKNNHLSTKSGTWIVRLFFFFFVVTEVSKFVTCLFGSIISELSLRLIASGTCSPISAAPFPVPIGYSSVLARVWPLFLFYIYLYHTNKRRHSPCFYNAHIYKITSLSSAQSTTLLMKIAYHICSLKQYFNLSIFIGRHPHDRCFSWKLKQLGKQNELEYKEKVYFQENTSVNKTNERKVKCS